MKDTIRVIAIAGAVAGALDIAYAIVVFGTLGVSPVRIFQSIASGLLGPAAYDGGSATAVLGGVTHFAIASVMAAVYLAVSARLPRMRAMPYPSGALYGLLLFLVMYRVVGPLSAARVSMPEGWLLVGALFAHTALVGVPIALIVRRLTSEPS